jgi:hypothetical protein
MISGMGLAQRIRGFRQSRVVISLTRCFTDRLANSYQTADRWSKQLVVSQSASGATPVTAGSDSLAIDLGSIGWREKALGTRNSIPRPLHCLLLWEDTGRYGATPCNIPPPLEQTWGEKEQNHTQGCKRERKRKNENIIKREKIQKRIRNCYSGEHWNVTPRTTADAYVVPPRTPKVPPQNCFLCGTLADSPVKLIPINLSISYYVEGHYFSTAMITTQRDNHQGTTIKGQPSRDNLQRRIIMRQPQGGKYFTV